MDDADKDTEINSLEDPVTGTESSQSVTTNGQESPGSVVNASSSGLGATPPPKPKQPSSLHRLLGNFNVYLLLFVLLIIIAGIAGGVIYIKARNSGSNPSSQSLSPSSLSQLATSDVTVGEPQHTLNVQSNAVFTGNVLIRSSLQIAGTLQVGGDLAINGLRVTGNSTFDQVQITQSLAVTGDGAIQGQLNVQKSLNVNGGGTFLGALSAPQLTVGFLQLNGDLSISHHIAVNGSIPTLGFGSALGSGGTASVNGSDTAGSLTINTGSNAPAGCFLTLNFRIHFASTPHIVITPVGASAAGMAYYITRSTANFSVCTASNPPSSTTFGFDYVAFD